MSIPVPPILLKPPAWLPRYEDDVLTVSTRDSGSTYDVLAFGTLMLKGVTLKQMSELGFRLKLASKVLAPEAKVEDTT